MLVVADTDNHRIRKVVNGYVYTLAGLEGRSPQSGYADGVPANSQFHSPMGIAAESDGTLVVDVVDVMLVAVLGRGQRRSS